MDLANKEFVICKFDSRYADKLDLSSQKPYFAWVEFSARFEP